jgi:tetratricopeptide (TPR) repeat protein
MNRLMKFIFMMMVTICAGKVCAQSSDLSAKEHFDQGAALYGAGEYEEAVVHFRLANELKPSWKLWFNIGQSEAACRRYGLALEAFEKYLAMGGDNVDASRFQDVVAEMRRLRELVGNLEISGGPDNAQVVVDGILRATLPLEVDLRVTAGIAHDLKIVTDEKMIHSQTVTVGSTSSVAISLDVRKPSSGNAFPEADGATSEGEVGGIPGGQLRVDEDITVNPESNGATDTARLRPLKFTMLSSWVGSVLTLGLGVGFTVSAAKKETELNDLNNDLENGLLTADEYEQEYSNKQASMDSIDTISTVMWISSGVLAATAIVATIVYSKKKRETASHIAFLPGGVAIRF